ncbi:hypothetical protein PGTUg99_030330 [Puccinia graminis f. sp. tritici]|nr:hypothetical protein PGTUg99_030330 [Puccinia graminis f. sp. tritici]
MNPKGLRIFASGTNKLEDFPSESAGPQNRSRASKTKFPCENLESSSLDRLLRGLQFAREVLDIQTWLLLLKIRDRSWVSDAIGLLDSAIDFGSEPLKMVAESQCPLPTPKCKVLPREPNKDC